jgi:hypothetical protein
MNEKTSNPVKAPLITRPGASGEHVGTRNIVNFLPNIFQSTVNKQFLDVTLEQLMSSGSLVAINNYLGQRYNKRTATDNYITDNRLSDNYQFVPSIVNKDAQNNITQALSYDDLINTLKFNEVDINQQNKLFNEQGYTLDMPINYDMFINYQKYFWLVDILPPCNIIPTITDMIDIDDIVSGLEYTTPTLSTNNTLSLMNGMRIRFMPNVVDRMIQDTVGLTLFTFDLAYKNAPTIKVYLNNRLQDNTQYSRTGNNITFATAPAMNDEVEVHAFCAFSSSGNYSVGDIHIVDGVGDEGKIRLTKQFTSGQIEGTYSTRDWVNHTVYSSQEPSGFDEDTTSFDFKPYDIREWRMTTRDYVVEKRYSADQSAWARSNLWIHETAAQSVIDFENLDGSKYLADNFRGVRPIIEYKDGIEKYASGKKHIGYINHLIEATIDPATNIVGQSVYSHNSTGITTAWTNIGFAQGQKVIVDKGGYKTYYECIQSHGQGYDPTYYENKIYWNQLSDENLEDGDYILFLRTTNVAYTNKIFRVDGVGTSITLTEKFGDSSVPLNKFDKVTVLSGYNTSEWDDSETSKPYSGSEWYWNNVGWVYGQQKMHRSAGLRVRLYDAELTLLDDGVKYPDSDFAGDYIFNYGSNSSSKFDDALGFNPRYVDYGNTPGLSFDFGLGGQRYNYTLFSTDTNSSKTINIPGFYYYKNINTDRFSNGWSAIRGGQPVRRHIQHTITDVTKTINFNLGTGDYKKDTKFTFNLRNNLLTVDSENTHRINQIAGTLPTLYMSRNSTYDIESYFDKVKLRFLKFDGTAIGSEFVQSTGTVDTFQLTIGSPTYSALKYYHTDFPNKEGVLYFDDNISQNNIQVLRNGVDYTAYTLNNDLLSLTNNLIADDVYDITWYSDSKLTNADGEFLPSDNHTYNPQNKRLSESSFGDLIAHMRDQMENIPTFTGSYFGLNNYDTISHTHQFGGTIRQQAFSTELLGQTNADVETDSYSALKYSAGSYRRFKNHFINKVKLLNKTTDINIPVYELVDKALNEINLGKNAHSGFANSNMAMYRDYESLDYLFTNTMAKTFDLPVGMNTYDDANNHIQAWLLEDDGAGTSVWVPLVRDSDYTINQTQLTITKAVVIPSSGQATVHIRWYPQNAVSFIPSSAVKLGLVRPYQPELRTDYSLASTGTASDSVLIGHDGSVHARTGTELYDRNKAGFDPVDACLWDLELRIYNNLISGHASIQPYRSVMPTPSRRSPNTLQDMTTALLPEFNKWKVRNNVTEFNSSTYYNVADAFTYNYKDVGVGIGGWRGIYTYYFGTDRPHTHPWEMLGHNTKPSWWDANYSWTVPAERTALITALSEGHYNDPGAIIPKYLRDLAITKDVYNFDKGGNNILVTTAGVLNDPVTADVVASPTTAQASQDFEFGDWGPVEAEWRTSSEYKITLFVALMRTRPLWTINTFFTSNKRALLSEVGYDDTQWVYTNSNDIGDHTVPRLSGIKYSNSIIESVRVIDGGSGYTSAPDLVIYDNFGSGAKLQAHISGGIITNVTVTDPGKEYYNKPTILPSLGTAKFEVILSKDANKYFVGMSNAIIEFALYNGSTIDNLVQRFERLDYNPIVKTGGFVNANNQRFILESSQDKGSTVIPEENYSAVLYTSKPNQELFIGAVTISKTNGRYMLDGFDNSNQYFKYNKPRKNGTYVNVSEEVPVARYKEYEDEVTLLSYKTIVDTIQDVYDFIHGYNNYLQKQGWIVDWRPVASQFVYWANTTETTPLTIMPSTNKLEILDGDRGYFDSLNNKFDGVYNIVGANGKQITTNRVLINRELMNTDDARTVIQVKDTNDDIFGLRLYKVEVEHAIVFDNSTNFDDIIYKPELGQLHKRLTWKGSRTDQWNGKFYAPGYVIDNDNIVQNFDTTARELDQYYGTSNTLSNKQIVDVARFNAGYNKPQWAEELKLDDDTAFQFVKGTRKYRGTRFALDAFMRNVNLFGAESSATLYEQWAVRTADYGDTRSRDTLEFELTSDLLTGSPQPIRFFDKEITDVLTDVTVDVDANSDLLVTGNTVNPFPVRDAKTYTKDNQLISEDIDFVSDFVTAGLPLTSETDYRVINKNDFVKFPEVTRPAYKFDGKWTELEPWTNRKNYKYNDQVMHQGRSWAMLDADGYSGLNRPNDPIRVTGTISLPTVPSSGQTLTIDNNTITLNKSANATNLNVINVVGTQDIRTTDTVVHGSTLILGETANNSQTINFSNVVTTVSYTDIDKIGSVTNPTISGGNTQSLVIEGSTINFNDTVSSTQNITAQAALENGFNTSWTQNTSSIASTATSRINTLEDLRIAYLGIQTQTDWQNFLNSYHATSNAGLQVDVLLTLHATNPAFVAQLESFIASDVTIINNILGTAFVAANVIAGTSVITPSQIASAQSSLQAGAHITAFRTWLQTNPGIPLTPSTVVTTTSGSSFQTYTLTDIVNKINGTGIANVTASNDANRLKITKTTITPLVQFQLNIGAGTSNSAVGFNAGAETILATSVSTTTTPNLTITQVVNQINNAGITGITAQVNATNTNLLQLNSNNSQLFIGTGTSNSVLGVTTGITLAGSSVTTIDIVTSITDIVQLINNAGIDGVTASNSNNKLQLTSTNSTLIIGTGTANSTVGLIAQTYSATQSTISNVFDALVDANGNPSFIKMENDPNIFSIWVADNSEQGNFNQGFAVYQTMDFGMYITKACAGIEAGDDAQIIVSRQVGETQAHNLQVGEYVLIRGSTTVPNIDGIHQVTSIDANNPRKFFIDEFIEQEGGIGNIYPLRNVRFPDYQSLQNATTASLNGVYVYNFAGYRQNNQQTPIHAFVDNDGTGTPGVYKWTGTWDDTDGHVGGSWQLLRSGVKQAKNRLIENVKIYDAKRKSTITQLETWDPAKGILLGFIKDEIDYTLTADIAAYNYNTFDGELATTKSWGASYIGKRWWNLNTSIWLDYEQGSVDYQQNNWGRLFDGASIDVYEWTRSPVLPENWEQSVKQKTKVDGQPASGSAYYELINGEPFYSWSEETYFNKKTNRNETYYYFWVKDKTNFTGQRMYNTKQLSAVIQDPESFDVSWAAASSSDLLFLGNASRYITNHSVVQVNKIYESNATALQEWTLLAENDESVIPEYLHIKMRDSLAGFNNYKKRFEYTVWNSSVVYSKDNVVQQGSDFYISIANSNINVTPSTDTAMTNWNKIYDYDLPAETQQNDIDVWRGQELPDYNLHEYNRYGHLTRPRQSLFRHTNNSLVEARQNWVKTLNNILADINVINEVINWDSVFNNTFVKGNVNYSIAPYWNWVDWSSEDYVPGTVADKTVNTAIDLLELVNEQNGTYVYVREVTHADGINRPELYYWKDGTSKLVWKSKSTIEVSEEMWNQSKFGHGFDSSGFSIMPFDSDSSSVIGELFDLLRNKVFIGQRTALYNKLWFSCLHQAITQNTTDDFAFKTTYVKLKVDHPLLLDKANYEKYNIDAVESFFEDIKPFHTKLHTSIRQATHAEANNIEVEETDRRSVITMKYEDHSTRTWAGDTILQGGTFTVNPDNEDVIKFTTVDNTIEYVYNGNNFVQPVQEGWGNELVPQDYTENVSILVQTNASGSTETSDTRSFRMNMYMPQNIQESTAVVDAASTVTTTVASRADTTIVVNDATNLPDSGVVWMGNERIEYGAKDDNFVVGGALFYCTRGTYGTPVLNDTPIGTTVRHETRIPTLDNFAHYGDNLRMAYNDSGVSLSSTGITPEHAFIRNMGAGTI